MFALCGNLTCKLHSRTIIARPRGRINALLTVNKRSQPRCNVVRTFILRTLHLSQLIGVRCLRDSLTLRFFKSSSLLGFISCPMGWYGGGYTPWKPNDEVPCTRFEAEYAGGRVGLVEPGEAAGARGIDIWRSGWLMFSVIGKGRLPSAKVRFRAAAHSEVGGTLRKFCFGSSEPHRSNPGDSLKLRNFTRQTVEADWCHRVDRVSSTTRLQYRCRKLRFTVCR